MIKLTRLNGTVLLVNENFIEVAEEAPDTVLTMQNGHRYVIKEKVEEIIEKVNEFNRLGRVPAGDYNIDSKAAAVSEDGSDIDYLD